MRAFEAVAGAPWAIRPEMLELIAAISRREHIADHVAVIEKTRERYEALNPTGLARFPAKKLAGARNATVRGDVAILSVEGPLTRYAGFFSDISGGTSYEALALDLQKALDDPGVASILLHVDSPGGQVNGCAEFADMVFQARGTKPIAAYISHEGASAAYWIASAADRVIAAPTSMVGCIGTVLSVANPHADDGERVQFVSSQTPKKRPDPTTKDGRAQIQSLVDSLSEVFIENIARNRGITPDAMVEQFDGGRLWIGQASIDAGLADALGTFEGVVTALADDPLGFVSGDKNDPGASAPGTTQQQEDGDRDEPHASNDDHRETPPPAEPAAEATTPHVHQEGRKMSWKDNFLRAVAGLPDDLDAEAGEGATPPPVATGKPADRAGEPSAAERELLVLRERAATLESENRRIRLDRINDQAEVFAKEIILAGRAFPAEQTHLVGEYVQAALDDDVLGSVKRSDGSTTTRIAMLKAHQADRPTHQLTTESLVPSLHRMMLSAQEPVSQNTDKPVDQAKVDELIGMTPLGRGVLDAARNGRN